MSGRRKFESWATVTALSVASATAACSGGGEFSSANQGAGSSGGSSSGGSTNSAGGTESGGSSSSGGVAVSGGSPSSGGLAQSGGSSPGGGTGGSLPDAGSSGGADSGPEPQCRRDDECAAFACDSEPRCIDGACVLGACKTADAGSCTAECVRGESGASCVVQGKDTDGDGHRDALCPENPGDDCDDSNRTVYSGAAEACDGLDNDCDGAADLADGLPLGGTPKTVFEPTSGKSARMAIVARPGGYALLTGELDQIAVRTGSPSEFRLLTTSGDVESTTALTPTSPVNDAALVYNGTGYLVLNTAHQARALNQLGVLGGLLALGSSIPYSLPLGYALTSSPSGTSAAVWAEHPTDANGPSVLAGRTIDAAGNPGSVMKIGTAANVQSFAGRASIVSRGPAGYAVAWVESRLGISGGTIMNQVVHLTLTNSALQATADYELDTTEEAPETINPVLQGERTRPQVVVDGAAFVVGYLAQNDSMRFVRLDAAGKRLCGPTTLSGFGSWAANGAMVRAQQGVVFAATAPNRSAVLHRVSQPASGSVCTIERLGTINGAGMQVAVSNIYDTLGDTVMAAGPEGRLALSWVEREANPPAKNRIVFRLLGPRLCN